MGGRRQPDRPRPYRDRRLLVVPSARPRCPATRSADPPRRCQAGRHRGGDDGDARPRREHRQEGAERPDHRLGVPVARAPCRVGERPAAPRGVRRATSRRARGWVPVGLELGGGPGSQLYVAERGQRRPTGDRATASGSRQIRSDTPAGLSNRSPRSRCSSCWPSSPSGATRRVRQRRRSGRRCCRSMEDGLRAPRCRRRPVARPVRAVAPDAGPRPRSTTVVSRDRHRLPIRLAVPEGWRVRSSGRASSTVSSSCRRAPRSARSCGSSGRTRRSCRSCSRFVSDSAAADGGWADPGTAVGRADDAHGRRPAAGSRPDLRSADRRSAGSPGPRRTAGWWRALGPEVPWLTSAIVDWLTRATGPAVDRFRWPGALKIDLDRRTRLPTYAWFADVVRSVSEMPGLAGAIGTSPSSTSPGSGSSTRSTARRRATR